MKCYCTVIINAPASYTALRNNGILINGIILKIDHSRTIEHL